MAFTNNNYGVPGFGKECRYCITEIFTQGLHWSISGSYEETFWNGRHPRACRYISS